MPNFPITHESTWKEVGPVGQDFHIGCFGTITSQGQVQITKTTSSNSWGLGFTGGDTMLAEAADGTIVWSSTFHATGVDAKSVFWGQSVRQEKWWDEWIPADKLAQVDHVEFLLAHTPHDRWAEDWAKVRSGIGDVVKTAADVVAAVADIKNWIKPKVS